MYSHSVSSFCVELSSCGVGGYQSSPAILMPSVIVASLVNGRAIGSVDRCL